MKSTDLLDRWKLPLSKHLGRSEQSVLADGLLASDFPEFSVRIVFEDGSDLTFRHAFYLGDIDSRTVDNTVCRVAVFTAHVGYHEFWLGSQDNIGVVTRRKQSLAGPLAACDPEAPPSDEDSAWDNMAPIGREFGSPDYERLMEHDQAVFESNLSSLIKLCRDLAEARTVEMEAEEHQDAVNVQIALQELGHRVSLAVATEVWLHHSRSGAACWMSGAETPASAKKALIYDCLGIRNGGSRFNEPTAPEPVKPTPWPPCPP